MEKHIKVARAHRALSWLHALMLVLLGAMIFFVKDANMPNGVFVVLAFFAALFALHYFIGRGASARQHWARVASIMVAVLMLLGFPVGTIIGIYLLMNGIPSWDNENASASRVASSPG
jgi:membrane-bound ClpP family serine protease